METHNHPRIHFPETLGGKLVLVFGMVVAAAIVVFPTGLVYPFLIPLVYIIYGPNAHYGLQLEVLVRSILIGWVPYLAICLSIVLIKNRRVSRFLFFVLAILLISNVAGLIIYIFGFNTLSLFRM